MMMRRILALVALGACACEREPQERSQAAPPVPDLALPTEKVSKMPGVVPRPNDQAQLDRMILAGYTPHGDHLHAPGVNECPMTKGNELVM